MEIGPDDEANLKDISAKFKGMTVRLLPEVDGHNRRGSSASLSNTLDLAQEKAALPVTHY